MNRSLRLSVLVLVVVLLVFILWSATYLAELGGRHTQCDVSHFPSVGLLFAQSVSAPRDVISSSSSLSPPHGYVVWDERRVRCPIPHPLMDPPFLSVCSSRTDPYRSLGANGPHGKPGYRQLCRTTQQPDSSIKTRPSNPGTALIVLEDGFVGPVHGYPYNLTHTVRMNPWYANRFRMKQPLDVDVHQIACYDSAAVIHSVYEHVVGPHVILEVVPLIAFLLDRLPPHTPIITTVNPALVIMYESFHIDTSRLVPYDPHTLYHAHKLYWMRRPEEYSAKYYHSIRQRLQQQYPRSMHAEKPVIVLVERPKKKRRQITNHAELLAGLEEAFPTEQYEIVTFKGGVSVNESIQLFSHASIIIGAHGGAFLNAMFAPSTAVLVEIAYPEVHEMPFPPYYYLQTCGLGMYHWVVFAETGSYWTNNLTVNVSEIIRITRLAWEQRRMDMLDSSTCLQTRLANMTTEEVWDPQPNFLEDSSEPAV